MTFGEMNRALAQVGASVSVDLETGAVTLKPGREPLPLELIEAAKIHKQNFYTGARIQSKYNEYRQRCAVNYKPGALKILSDRYPVIRKQLDEVGEAACKPWADWRESGGPFDLFFFEQLLAAWTDVWDQALALVEDAVHE